MDIKWQPGKPVIRVFAVSIIIIMLMMNIKIANEVSAVPVPFDLTISQSVVADLDWLVQTSPTGIIYDQANDQYEVQEGGSILVQGTLIIRNQKLLLDEKIKVNGIVVIEDSQIDTNLQNKWDGFEINSGAECYIYRSKITNANLGISTTDADFVILESEISNSNNGIYISNSDKILIEENIFDSITGKNIEFNNNYIYNFPTETKLLVLNNTISQGQYGIYSTDSSINITGNNISSTTISGIHFDTNNVNDYYSFIYNNILYQNYIDIYQNNIDQSRVLFNDFIESNKGMQHTTGYLLFKYNRIIDIEEGISITSANIGINNNDIQTSSEGMKITSSSGSISENIFKLISGNAIKLISSTLTITDNIIDENLYNISRYGNNQGFYSDSENIEYFQDFSRLSSGILEDCSAINSNWTSLGSNGIDSIDLDYVSGTSASDYCIESPQMSNPGIWDYESTYNLYCGGLDDFFSTKFKGDYLCNPSSPPTGIGLQLEVDIGIYSQDLTEEHHVVYSFVPFDNNVYPYLFEPSQLGIYDSLEFMEETGFEILLDPVAGNLYYFWDGITSISNIGIETNSLKDWLETHFSWNELMNPPGTNPEFSGSWHVTPRLSVLSAIPSQNPFDYGKVGFDYLQFGRNYLKNGYFVSSPIDISSDYSYNKLIVDYLTNGDDSISMTILDDTDNPIPGFEGFYDDDVDITSLGYQEIKLEVTFSSDGYSSSQFFGYKIVCDTNTLNGFDISGGSTYIENTAISPYFSSYYTVSSNADITLVDSDYFTNKAIFIDTLSSIIVKWKISLSLIDEYGSPKIGTTVSFSDRGDVNTQSIQTDSNGNIDDVLLTQGEFKKNSMTYNTPHHVYISSFNSIYKYISSKESIQLVYGLDSDQDSIDDSEESDKSIAWISPSQITNTGSQRNSLIFPDENLIIFDDFISLPINTQGNVKYNIHFEMNNFLTRDVKVSYNIYDGYGSTPILSDFMYLSKDVNWYSTEYFTPTSNFIRVRISSDEIGCYLSQIRLEGYDLPLGQISNPLNGDTDSDLINDGLEIRDNTFWFEAELFNIDTSTNIIHDKDSSNSKSIQPKTTSNAIIAEIPVSLGEGNYQFFIRSGYNDYSIIDDFSSGQIDGNVWSTTGQPSIEEEELVLSSSSSISTIGAISHNHIEFDYYIGMDTESGSEFKVSIGSYSVTLGNGENDISFYEIGNHYRFHINIDRDNDYVSFYREDDIKGIKLLKTEEISSYSSFVLKIETISSNTNIQANIDNIVYSHLPGSVSKLKIDFVGSSVPPTSEIIVQSYQYEWYSVDILDNSGNLFDFSNDDYTIRISYNHVSGGSRPNIDKIAVVNLDEVLFSVESTNYNAGSSAQITLPDGEITKSILRIKGDPITETINLPYSGQVKDIAISSDFGVIDLFYQNLYYLLVYDIENPNNGLVEISSSQTISHQPCIDNNRIVFRTGTELKICEFDPTISPQIFFSLPLSDSNSNHPDISIDNICWFQDGSTDYVYSIDIDQDNDGIIDFKDRQGKPYIDDDQDTSSDNEILNGINDDGDSYGDMGGSHTDYDPGIDSVIIDLDSDFKYTTSDDTYLYGQYELDNNDNGKKFVSFTAEDMVYFYDDNSNDKYDWDSDGLWYDVIGNGIYDENEDEVLEKPTGLAIFDGQKGINIVDSTSIHVAYYETYVSNSDSFDPDDLVYWEETPFALTYSDSGDTVISDPNLISMGDPLYPLIDEDISYCERDYLRIKEAVNEPVEPQIDGNRIVYEDSGKLIMIDLSYLSSLFEGSVGSHDPKVIELLDVVYTEVPLIDGERVIDDDDIYHIGSGYLNSFNLQGIAPSCDSIIDVSNDNILFEDTSGSDELIVIPENYNGLNEYITISDTNYNAGNDFGRISNERVIFTESNMTVLKIMKSHWSIDIFDDSNIEWETESLFYDYKWVGDFSDELNQRTNNNVNIKLSSKYSSSNPTISLDQSIIEIEYITDVLFADTDFDSIKDGSEVNNYYGNSVLEFEDSILIDEWKDPRTNIQVLEGSINKKIFDYQTDPFIHQTGISLSTSRELIGGDGIEYSMVELPIDEIEESTNYEFVLNPAPKEQSIIVNQPIYNVYVKKGENDYSPKSPISEDVEVTQEVIDYLEEVVKSILIVEVIDGDGRSLSSESTELEVYIDSIESFPKINFEVNFGNNNRIEKIIAVKARIRFELNYFLIEHNEYRLSVRLDYSNIPMDLDMRNPIATNVPESTYNFFDDIGLISILELDRLKINSKGLDPFNIDSDNDGIADGFECGIHGYPNNDDPDRDGLNDRLELLVFGTDPEYRDSDYDGVRDGVELGLSPIEIQQFGGDLQSRGSWTERLLRFNDPYLYKKIDNWDHDFDTNNNGEYDIEDNMAITPFKTDPNQKDTDEDGLPDGWIDGWRYGFSQIGSNDYSIANYQRSFIDNMEYWQYEESNWQSTGIVDNYVSIFEGEDFNCDGKKYSTLTTWTYDVENNYENSYQVDPTTNLCYWSELDPYSFSTDSDGVPDGYEVIFSAKKPYYYPDTNFFTINPDDQSDCGNDVDIRYSSSVILTSNAQDENEIYPETGNLNSAIAQRILYGSLTEDFKDIDQLSFAVNEYGISKFSAEIWIPDGNSNIQINSLANPTEVEPFTCLYNTILTMDMKEDNKYNIDLPDNLFKGTNLPSENVPNGAGGSINIPYFYLVLRNIEGRGSLSWLSDNYLSDNEFDYDDVQTIHGTPFSFHLTNGKWVADISQSGTQWVQNIYNLEIIESSESWGDFLTNKEEYLLGINPKSPNTDRKGIPGMREDDYDDGEEAGVTSENDITFDRMIFYTDVENGAVSIDNYGDCGNDHIEYRVFNYENEVIGGKYGLIESYVDPSPDIEEWLSLDSNIILKLYDGTDVYLTENHKYLFLHINSDIKISEHLGIDAPRDRISSISTPGGVIDPVQEGLFHVFEWEAVPTPNLGGSVDSGRNQRLFVSDLNRGDSDFDGLSDDVEISFVESLGLGISNGALDFDGSGDSMCYDPDQDNDGIIDGNEIDWYIDVSTANNMGIPETDVLPPVIDIDSDGDGVVDGIESLYFKTDPSNPDSDGDGLVDGYVDNYIFDQENGAFKLHSQFTDVFSSYSIESDTVGSFDSWEGESGRSIKTLNQQLYFLNNPLDVPMIDVIFPSKDTNGEYVHTDPNNEDTDGDGLWDGFDIYDPSDVTNRNSNDPEYFGEIYITGMPFSGGDYLRSFQDSGESGSVQSTDPNDDDSDDDEILDGDEVVPSQKTINILKYKPDQYNPKYIFEYEESLRLFSNPLIKDTDSDGIDDIDEISDENGYFTIPTEADSDNDGHSDRYEILDYSTNPCSADTDNDGIPDFTNDYKVTSGYSFGIQIEVGSNTYLDICEIGEDVWGTDPLNDDTDEDGYSDLEEIISCLERLSPNNDILIHDFEDDYSILEEDLSFQDDHIDLRDDVYNWIIDQTGTSSEEYFDIDNDGLFSPNDFDSDNDLIPDIDEVFYLSTDTRWTVSSKRSDALNDDTDGDDIFDGAEGRSTYYLNNASMGNTYNIHEDNDLKYDLDPNAPNTISYDVPACLDYDSDSNVIHPDNMVPDGTDTYVMFRTNSEWKEKDSDNVIEYLDYSDSDQIAIPDDFWKTYQSTNGNVLGANYELAYCESTGNIVTQTELTNSNIVIHCAGIYYPSTVTVIDNILTPDGKCVYYDYSYYGSSDPSNMNVYIPYGSSFSGGSYTKFYEFEYGGTSGNSVSLSPSINKNYFIDRQESYDRRKASSVDNDGDGLSSICESKYGLSDSDDDCDDDGLLDGNFFELELNNIDGDSIHGFLDDDTDNDGIKDGDEDRNLDGIFSQTFGLETHPWRDDTDFDGLKDGAEFNLDSNEDPILTSPLYDPIDFDFDDDGLPDGFEVDPINYNYIHEIGDITIDLTDLSKFCEITFDSENGKLTLSEQNWKGRSGNSVTSLSATNPDTDGDGLIDGFELGIRKENVMTTKTLDKKLLGIKGTSDIGIIGPNYNKLPSNGFMENVGVITNPLDWDTDGDKIPDGWMDQKMGYGIIAGNQPVNNPYRNNENSEFYSELGQFEPWEGEMPWKFDNDVDPIISFARILPDRDFDGLSDNEEIFGWHIVTGSGNSEIIAMNTNLGSDNDEEFFTDPNNIDTDGDGLVDGKSRNVKIYINDQISSAFEDRFNFLLKFKDEDGSYFVLNDGRYEYIEDVEEGKENEKMHRVSQNSIIAYDTPDPYVYIDRDISISGPDITVKSYLGEIDFERGMILNAQSGGHILERQSYTNPVIFDTDGDGLSDGDEINGWQRYSRVRDSIINWKFHKTDILADDDDIPYRIKEGYDDSDQEFIYSKYIQTDPTKCVTNNWFNMNKNGFETRNLDLFKSYDNFDPLMDGYLLFDMSPENGMGSSLSSEEIVEGNDDINEDTIPPEINIIGRADSNGLQNRDGDEGEVSLKNCVSTDKKMIDSLENLNIKIRITEAESYIDALEVKISVTEWDTYDDDHASFSLPLELKNNRNSLPDWISTEESKSVNGFYKEVVVCIDINLMDKFSHLDKWNEPDIKKVSIEIEAVDANGNGEGEIVKHDYKIKKGVWEHLVHPGISHVVHWILNGNLKKDFEKYLNYAKEILENFLDALENIINTIGFVFTSIMNHAYAVGEWVYNTLSESISSIIEKISINNEKESTTEKGTNGQVLCDSLGVTEENEGGSFTEVLTDLIKDFLGPVKIIDMIMKFIGKFQEILDKFNVFKKIGKEIMNVISHDDGGKTKFDNIKKIITEGLSENTDKTSVKKFFLGIIGGIIDGFVMDQFTERVKEDRFGAISTNINGRDIYKDMNQIKTPYFENNDYNKFTYSRNPDMILGYQFQPLLSVRNGDDSFENSLETIELITVVTSNLIEWLMSGLSFDIPAIEQYEFIINYILSLFFAVFGGLAILVKEIVTVDLSLDKALSGPMLGLALFSISSGFGLNGFIGNIITQPSVYWSWLIGGVWVIATYAFRYATLNAIADSFCDKNRNGLLDIEETTFSFSIDIAPFGDSDYTLYFKDIIKDRWDNDDDGIPDGIELMPLVVHYKDKDGRTGLNSRYPLPFGIIGDDNYAIDTYEYHWKFQNYDIYDIDSIELTKNYFIYTEGNSDYMICLDPTNSDTDGDNKPDLDEIRDNAKNYPGDSDFIESQSTNPLNPLL